MKRKTKTQKGITLIALIITIVVLLILAVVAISSIQNDGILSYANNAAITYNQAQKNEQDILDGYLSHMPGNNNGSSTNEVFAQITADNYGDSITFSTDLNSNGNTTDDWKVFYKDSDYLYIISAGVLPNSYVPSSLKSGDDYITTSETYGVGFNITSSTLDTNNQSSGTPASIENDVAQKYMFSWWLKDEYNGSNNVNVKAVALLLNTDAWTGSLVNSELATAGVEAIGTPTLDMWAASWNGKYSADSELGQYNYSYSDIGYSVNLGNYTGQTLDNTLYSPYGSYSGTGEMNMYRCWLSGPASDEFYYGDAGMLEILEGVVSQSGANVSDIMGLRPIISIPASLVSGTIDALTVSK